MGEQHTPLASRMHSFQCISVDWNIRRAIAHWQQKGLISAEQARRLLASPCEEEHAYTERAAWMYAGLGGVFVCAGLTLFVIRTWHHFAPILQIFLLLSGIILTGSIGYMMTYERWGMPRIGSLFFLLNGMLFGAGLFLAASIFHLPLHAWLLFLLWFLGIAYFAYALRSYVHLWFSVPLFTCFLASFRLMLAGASADVHSILVDPHTSILPLLPLFGFTLLCLSTLYRRRELHRFIADGYLDWGVFFIFFPAVMGTVDQHVLFRVLYFSVEPLSIGLLFVALGMLILALRRGAYLTERGNHILLLCALFFVVGYVLVRLPEAVGVPVGIPSAAWAFHARMFQDLYIVHLVTTLSGLLGLVWFGMKIRRWALVNIGMGSIVLVIALQYFSWIFTTLDRSLGLAMGGVFIILLSILLGQGTYARRFFQRHNL